MLSLQDDIEQSFNNDNTSEAASNCRGFFLISTTTRLKRDVKMIVFLCRNRQVARNWKDCWSKVLLFLSRAFQKMVQCSSGPKHTGTIICFQFEHRTDIFGKNSIWDNIRALQTVCIRRVSAPWLLKENGKMEGTVKILSLTNCFHYRQSIDPKMKATKNKGWSFPANRVAEQRRYQHCQHPFFIFSRSTRQKSILDDSSKKS